MKKAECRTCTYCLSIDYDVVQCSNYKVAARLDDEFCTEVANGGITLADDSLKEYFVRLYNERFKERGQGYILESFNGKLCPDYRSQDAGQPCVVISKARVDWGKYERVA